MAKKKLTDNPLSLLFPEALLNYFKIVQIQEFGEVTSKKMIYHLYLEEQNQLPIGYKKGEYESKGFYPEKTIQDFPIRGKAVYLLIKRRRWRHKTTREEIRNDYSFIAEGSKLTQELSDFLKGTGRYPRRYH